MDLREKTPWKMRAVGESGGMVSDLGELLRGLKLFADPNGHFQIVALPSAASSTLPGLDLDGLVVAAQSMPAGFGVYMQINPVRPGLTGKAKGIDIVSRRWLFIDIDPRKDEEHKNNPASDAEKGNARQVCQEVCEHLMDGHNWPSPAILDSGNGYGLLYRIDLPNDPVSRSIIKRVLYSLAEKFGGAPAIIDKSVHNADRLAKLPGTWSRKGVQSDDRPWRMTRIIHAPSDLECVSREQIESAGGAAPPPPSPPPPFMNGHTSADPFTFTVKAGGKAGYARAALDGECARVTLASPGGDNGRNNTLNRAAYSLGQLVASGLLDRGEVESRLTDAARTAGLDNDPGCGERGISATIRSGIEAGMLSPRKVPEKVKTDPTAQPSTPAASAVPEGESVIYWASTVTPRSVEWLWPGRIPLGKLTTFAGVGGLGKTFVLCDIAARVSTGAAWPDKPEEFSECGKVLFISGEDEADDTLVPRLIEMKADLNKIAFLKTEVQDRFTMADLKTLDAALQGMGDEVRFVAIDPPTAYLGGVNDHNNAELRALLTPLKTWAAKHRIALIFNTHVNKPQGAKVDAMMRVMGSVAWVNAVRAAHMFARDPEDPDRRLFCGMKNNLGPEMKGLAYRLASVGDLARVEWLGEVDLTADEAINGPGPRERRDVVASDWLIQKFKEKHEWSSDVLMEAARQEGLSRNAIFEAKRKLDLPKCRKHTKENGDTEWLWWVPENWIHFNPASEGGIPL